MTSKIFFNFFDFLFLIYIFRGFFRGPSSPEAMKFCEDQQEGGILTVVRSLLIFFSLALLYIISCMSIGDEWSKRSESKVSARAVGVRSAAAVST